MSQTQWSIGLTEATQPVVEVKKQKASRVKQVASIPDSRTTIAGGLVTDRQSYRAWWASLIWSRWAWSHGCPNPQ